MSVSKRGRELASRFRKQRAEWGMGVFAEEVIINTMNRREACG